MPTKVELPDGSIAEFPDGTSREAMEAAIRAHLGGPAPSGPPIVRSREVQPLQNGMSMAEATYQKEDFPELPSAFRGLSRDQVLEAARGNGSLNLRNADPNAELSQDKYGNPTLSMNGQQYYFNKPGPSYSDLSSGARRAAGTAVDAATEAAPYLYTGVASSGLRALPAMAAQAFTGAAEETVDQANKVRRGEEADWSQVGKMSLTAAAGEGIGRALVGAVSGVIRRLPGGERVPVFNSDGSLTDDAIRTLQANNVSPAQVDDAVRQNLTNSNTLTPEQAQRFNLFNKYGMTGTRAQVMRTADDFQQQQELLKTSGRVRNALESQRVQVQKLMGEVAESGRPSGYSAYEAITNRATQLDDEISALYKTAREAIPEGQGVRLEGLVNSMRRYAGADKSSGGLISDLAGSLKSRGVISGRGWDVTGRIDVATAEEIRKEINLIYPSLTDRGRQLARIFKDSLDDDVFKFAGDDVFRQARNAKASFEAGLNRTKNNKFDQRTTSLVRDVLENKVNPDAFFEQTVLSSSRRASDLEDLRSYLTTGTEGQVEIGTDAWETLRKDTMEFIRDRAFDSLAKGEQGVPELSAHKMRQALRRIGSEKLRVIFKPEELGFINDMMKIAEARTPVDTTQLGKGPTSQAVKYAVDKFADIATKGNSGAVVPLLGDILDYLRTNPVLNPSKEIARTIQTARRAAPPSVTERVGRAISAPVASYAADR